MSRPNQATYAPATWRLIHDFTAPGAAHMARDEAIVQAVAAGAAPPTLCFYSWEPAGLSIGADQPADIVDEDACAAQGWDVVRRPTTGRAVLHADELAFSIIMPLNDERGGDAAGAFDHLIAGLLAGLQEMGLNPQRAKPYYEDHGDTGDAAFDGPDALEITMGGRKLVTNAQWVHEGVLLQQGGLPLYGDTTRVAQALFFDYPGQNAALAARMRYRAANLLLYLGQKLTPPDAAAPLGAGFARELNLTLTPGELTPAEAAAAAELQAKYQAFE